MVNAARDHLMEKPIPREALKNEESIFQFFSKSIQDLIEVEQALNSTMHQQIALRLNQNLLNVEENKPFDGLFQDIKRGYGFLIVSKGQSVDFPANDNENYHEENKARNANESISKCFNDKDNFRWQNLAKIASSQVTVLPLYASMRASIQLLKARMSEGLDHTEFGDIDLKVSNPQVHVSVIRNRKTDEIEKLHVSLDLPAYLVVKGKKTKEEWYSGNGWQGPTLNMTLQ